MRRGAGAPGAVGGCRPASELVRRGCRARCRPAARVGSAHARHEKSRWNGGEERRRPESNRCRRLCSALGSPVLRLPMRFSGTPGALRCPQKTLEWGAFGEPLARPPRRAAISHMGRSAVRHAPLLRLQSRGLVLRQLEHEVGRETIDVPPDLLDQTTCLYPVELCEILIEHHMTFANNQNPLLASGSRGAGSAPASSLSRFGPPFAQSATRCGPPPLA
jgi:hypothetical protein